MTDAPRADWPLIASLYLLGLERERAERAGITHDEAQTQFATTVRDRVLAEIGADIFFAAFEENAYWGDLDLVALKAREATRYDMVRKGVVASLTAELKIIDQ